jgi:GH24 family phage-related lysozyme (muramidase)
MRISNKGIELIKQFEGCRLKAYKDPAGVPTIAYGHTAGVKMGDTITQEQADELLRDDLVIYEGKVDKYDDKYHWNQNQFDALVSFAYNIGSIDQLTSNGRRSIKTISEKILEYNKAGGKKLEGLVRRRKAEKALFDEAVEGDSSAVEPQPSNSTPTETEAKDEAQAIPYKVGGVYTVSVRSALNVRKGAGKNYDLVGFRNLTPDGKTHANHNGALLNGTKVTVKEVKIAGEQIWLKIPSGWICGKDGAKILVK